MNYILHKLRFDSRDSAYTNIRETYNTRLKASVEALKGLRENLSANIKIDRDGTDPATIAAAVAAQLALYEAKRGNNAETRTEFKKATFAAGTTVTGNVLVSALGPTALGVATIGAVPLIATMSAFALISVIYSVVVAYRSTSTSWGGEILHNYYLNSDTRTHVINDMQEVAGTFLRSLEKEVRAGDTEAAKTAGAAATTTTRRQYVLKDSQKMVINTLIGILVDTEKTSGFIEAQVTVGGDTQVTKLVYEGQCQEVRETAVLGYQASPPSQQLCDAFIFISTYTSYYFQFRSGQVVSQIDALTARVSELKQEVDKIDDIIRPSTTPMELRLEPSSATSTVVGSGSGTWRPSSTIRGTRTPIITGDSHRR